MCCFVYFFSEPFLNLYYLNIIYVLASGTKFPKNQVLKFSVPIQAFTQSLWVKRFWNVPIISGVNLCKPVPSQKS